MNSSEFSKNSRILIILGGALGDIARGLTIPALLKEYSSNIHISWLVDIKWKSFLELCPDIDTIIPFDRKEPLKSVFALRRDLKALEPFDYSLDLQRHLKSGFFSFLAKADTRIGFSRADAKEYNWIFNNRYISKIDNQRSKVYHYLKFLSLLNSEFPTEPKFGIDAEQCISLVKKYYEGVSGPIVSLILGSSWDSKDWTLEGYTELIRSLSSDQNSSQIGKIVLSGDGSQRELSEHLERLSPANILNLVGKTDLKELCGVIAKSDLLIGPDTGPGHISAIFNKPYIGLFGPTDHLRVAPFGSEHLAQIAEVSCRPCWKRKCPGMGGVCMSELSVPRIVQQSLDILRN